MSLAALCMKVRRNSLTQDEVRAGSAATSGSSNVSSQFDTSMKMLKTQMVFAKYKGKKRPEQFRNRTDSQFKESFSRIKSLISQEDGEGDEMRMYSARVRAMPPVPEEEGVAQTITTAGAERGTAAPAQQQPDDFFPEHDGDEDPDAIMDMFMSPGTDELGVESTHDANAASQLDEFWSPADAPDDSLDAFATEAEYPDIDYTVDMHMYGHQGWTPVSFHCVVFVNFETEAAKELFVMPLWVKNSMLELGTVIVAWEGLIFQQPNCYEVKVPYDKIISWTIETSVSSDENFVDITMDGTFDRETGHIAWFTDKLLEIRCCVSCAEEARALSTSIKEVCIKIREEAMSSVDIKALRRSSIGKAFMSGVDKTNNLMNARQRRASLMRKE